MKLQLNQIKKFIKEIEDSGHSGLINVQLNYKKNKESELEVKFIGEFDDMSFKSFTGPSWLYTLFTFDFLNSIKYLLTRLQDADDVIMSSKFSNDNEWSGTKALEYIKKYQEPDGSMEK